MLSMRNVCGTIGSLFYYFDLDLDLVSIKLLEKKTYLLCIFCSTIHDMLHIYFKLSLVCYHK